MEREAKIHAIIAAIKADAARQRPSAFDFTEEGMQDDDSNVALDLREIAEAALKALDMQTCETCRHWKRYDGKFGYHADDAMKGPAGSCETEDDRIDVQGEMTTRADFGCVAHEPRENQTP